MKKLEWSSMFESKDKKLENKLKRRVKSLYKLARKYGVDWIDVYVLSTDEQTMSLNIMAKHEWGSEMTINDFAFVR